MNAFYQDRPLGQSPFCFELAVKAAPRIRSMTPRALLLLGRLPCAHSDERVLGHALPDTGEIFTSPLFQRKTIIAIGVIERWLAT